MPNKIKLHYHKNYNTPNRNDKPKKLPADGQTGCGNMSSEM